MSRRRGHRRGLALAGAVAVLLAAMAATAGPLHDARRGFTTRLVAEWREDTPLEAPPPDLFTLVTYPAPLGENTAYLSANHAATDSAVGGRPAIVWLTGGMPTSRGGPYVWRQGPDENDQSAAPFRQAGLVMLFPTVRGTAANPGRQEAMLGEVDDVIAAATFLRGVPGVDPDRIYLGGHSTGGTLALLVAEATDMFRAVFAFGPVPDIADYGGIDWPFDTDDPNEFRVRSPLHFLDAITTPTLVCEGEGGNVEDMELLASVNRNPLVSLLTLPDADHFTPLVPVNRLLAARIVAGHDDPFPFDTTAIAQEYARFRAARSEP